MACFEYQFFGANSVSITLSLHQEISFQVTPCWSECSPNAGNIFPVECGNLKIDSKSLRTFSTRAVSFDRYYLCGIYFKCASSSWSESASFARNEIWRLKLKKWLTLSFKTKWRRGSHVKNFCYEQLIVFALWWCLCTGVWERERERERRGKLNVWLPKWVKVGGDWNGGRQSEKNDWKWLAICRQGSTVKLLQAATARSLYHIA